MGPAENAPPLERWHDAGEPAGTGGPPIRQAIRGAGLSNTVVVVTRYFGGTRLGKGGLARAYRGAAAQALATAPMVLAVRKSRLRVSVPIALDGETRHLVSRHGGRVGPQQGGEPSAQQADGAGTAQHWKAQRETEEQQRPGHGVGGAVTRDQLAPEGGGRGRQREHHHHAEGDHRRPPEAGWATRPERVEAQRGKGEHASRLE